MEKVSPWKEKLKSFSRKRCFMREEVYSLAAKASRISSSGLSPTTTQSPSSLKRFDIALSITVFPETLTPVMMKQCETGVSLVNFQ